MKGTLSLTIIAGTVTDVLAGTQCAGGFKHKSDLTNLMCMTKVNNAASCSSECCEENPNTCGGIDSKKAIVCPFNSYKDATDAWKNTPATDDNAVKVCCKKKSTCASATCPPGYELDTPADAKLCTGSSKSCSVASSTAGCCIKDDKTCFGQHGVILCGAVTKLVDSSMKADDAWRGTLFNADYPKNCCRTKQTCAGADAAGGITCPAGKKKKTAGDCTDKAGSATADVKDCSRDDTIKPKKGETIKPNPCCEWDFTTCQGATHATGADKRECAGSKYVDKNSYQKKPALTSGKIADATFQDQCCTEKATCKRHTCRAGYKTKFNGDSTACPADAASCDTSLCCQTDPTTCAGQTNIVCSYGFYSEQTTWTDDTTDAAKSSWNGRKANATNKNINCCTPRAICDPTATTTPFPATFTPPAFAALKYGEKKVKKDEESATATYAVWLFSGAIVGTSVLIIMRSFRPSSAERGDRFDSDTDNEMLLPRSEE